jgi:hypothetical protein
MCRGRSRTQPPSERIQRPSIAFPLEGQSCYVAKPFDFVYLERAIMAGLAQGGVGGSVSAAPAAGDAWRDLALAVFQAVRGMNVASRASTGARLEEAVLAAAREASAGRANVTAAALRGGSICC